MHDNISKIQKIITVGLLSITLVNAETRYVHKDTNKFLNTIWQVESSGRNGVIIGDNGNARGPLQIWKSFYIDAVEASKGELNRPYEDVSEIKFAKEVALWYFYRYARKELEEGNFEVLAKIFNGGPNGHKKESTEKYWTKVKKVLKND